MAADLIINIVEGAQNGQPPTPPAMPAPAPAPPPFVQPPPPVGIPDPSPRVPGGERAPRSTPEEREALEEARKANRHLDATAAGIVGLGQQILNGIRVPSVDRLVGIAQSIVTLLAGQRAIDIVRGGVRSALPQPASVGRPIGPPEISDGMPVARAGSPIRPFALELPPSAQAGAFDVSSGMTSLGAPRAGMAAGQAAAAGLSAAGVAAAAAGTSIAIFAAAGIAAALVVRQWSSAMQQSIIELAQYSGVLSAQRGIQQFEMTMLEMERTRRLEDPLSRMQVRGDRLEQLQYQAITELLSLGASIFKLVEPFAEGFVDFAEISVAGLAKLVAFAEAYMLVLSKGFGSLPNEIQEFILYVKIIARRFGLKLDDPPKEDLRDRMIDMLEGLARG